MSGTNVDWEFVKKIEGSKIISIDLEEIKYRCDLSDNELVVISVEDKKGNYRKILIDVDGEGFNSVRDYDEFMEENKDSE